MDGLVNFPRLGHGRSRGKNTMTVMAFSPRADSSGRLGS